MSEKFSRILGTITKKLLINMTTLWKKIKIKEKTPAKSRVNFTKYHVQILISVTQYKREGTWKPYKRPQQ